MLIDENRDYNKLIIKQISRKDKIFQGDQILLCFKIERKPY